ncbi:N-acetyltransferase family protein [Methylobacterium sp. JK268]
MQVREMEPSDVPAVAALFAEMQAHYRAPCPPRETILAGLRSPPAGVTILVAAGPDLRGFAALGAVYPGPGLRPGLFLKDLYVSQSARGCGIGTRLLRAAARLATERGFARLDWTADAGNAALLAFYEARGAAALRERVFFRLSGPALDRLAAEP